MIPAILLLSINAAVAFPLFRIEYLKDMGSIEGIFMALASHAFGNWGGDKWWPLWNLGMPFHEAYQPFLPFLAASLSWLTGHSIPLSLHAAEAGLYILGPLALFYFVKRLANSAPVGFLAAILYSGISPSIYLFHDVRSDIGQWFAPQRLHSIVHYGDGPHVLSLTLLPVALLAIDLMLDHGNRRYFGMAVLTTALVPLANIPGTIVLGVAAAALLISSCLATRRLLAPILTLAGIAIIACIIVVFWTPPSAVWLMLTNMPKVAPPLLFPNRYVAGWVCLVTTYIFAAALLRYFRIHRYFGFFTLFSMPLLIVNGFHYWLSTDLVTQPWRYHLALEMALCGLIAGIGLLRFSGKPIVIGAFFLLCAVGVAHDIRYSSRSLQPIDITTTSEYKVATWLGRYGREGRAMVPGSMLFWVDAFAPVPLVTGCCDQNLRVEGARYAQFIFHSDLGAESSPAQVSLSWLQAFGVKWIVAAGPRSTEVYHAMTHPMKFSGILREVWRDSSDDIIYAVPLAEPILGQIINRQDLPARFPASGIDTAPLDDYVRALERSDQKETTLEWIGDGKILVKGYFSPGQVLSTHIAYNPNWRAVSNKNNCHVFPDKLAMMAVAPCGPGRQEMTLIYETGVGRKLVKSISLVTLAIMLACILNVRPLRTAS